MPSDSPRNGDRAPDLTPFARTAVRLHPRPGTPSAHESHIGGPLLWPADESWPYCVDTVPSALVPADGLTEAHPVEQPMPLAGVAQFFSRDFPALPFPEGTDLLQVLFCPDPHDGPDYWGPAVHLVWRDSGAVTGVLAEPPATIQHDDYEYLPPRPCSLAPCEVLEYPRYAELPPEIQALLPFEDEDDAEEEWPAAVQGCKLGGWNFWSGSDAGSFPRKCPDCDARLELLLFLDTYEGAAPHCSCEGSERVGWDLSAASVNVFACPADPRHRIRLHAD